MKIFSTAFNSTFLPKQAPIVIYKTVSQSIKTFNMKTKIFLLIIVLSAKRIFKKISRYLKRSQLKPDTQPFIQADVCSSLMLYDDGKL